MLRPTSSARRRIPGVVPGRVTPRRRPRQYLFPPSLRTRTANDVFIQPRSGAQSEAVFHTDKLDAVASLRDAANRTGLHLKSVFCRVPGHTSGSGASIGNPSGWIYRLGHCFLHRSLSLKPACRAYGLRDQRQMPKLTKNNRIRTTIPPKPNHINMVQPPYSPGHGDS